MESRTVTTEASGKRPRSESGEFPPIASKVPKTHSNHLQINYLARQYPDNLPLVSTSDTMSEIIRLIGDYEGVLHRHESIAGNLGACPLGPILIKRFERLFDGPPKVLKSHGKDSSNVTWLDVVEFARSKPEQFNLEKSRNGVPVCQFYTKQCRVEISEEDFVLIHSGMPQKMIPPQPIIEDEEKELGALEILEKNLQQIIQMADQVSARARQLNHRLKNRKTAIVTRRENDVTLHASRPSLPLSQPQSHIQQRSMSPVWRDGNGTNHTPLNSNGTLGGNSPSTGFVAVNAARSGAEGHPEENSLSAPFLFSQSGTENVTIINGQSIKGASPTTRAELMKKFFTTQDRHTRGYEESSGSSNRQSSRPRPRVSEGGGDYNLYAPTPATVAIPNTPTSLLPPPKSHHHEKDDGGPFKIEMVARMEELQRGDRILPPCDRCRRLHMDCLKNLTACMGCTKKHAKCSWRDVKEEELRETQRIERETAEDTQSKETSATPTTLPADQVPLPAATPASAPVSTVVVPELERAHERAHERPHDRPFDRPQERPYERPYERQHDRPLERPFDRPLERPLERPFERPHERPQERPLERQYERPHERPHERPQDRSHDGPVDVNMRRESAPIAAPISRPPIIRDISPRRAMSENQGSHGYNFDRHDRRISINRKEDSAPDDDAPDAGQRLMQAILDTVDHHRVSTAAKGGVHEVSNERERERDREREREREREQEQDRKLVKA